MKRVERILLIGAIILGSFTAYILGYATGMNQLIGVASTPQLQAPATDPSLSQAVNDYRATQGKPALQVLDTLNASAKVRADEIAGTGKSAYQHTRPNGTLFSTAIDTSRFRSVNENLVECAVGNKDAVQSWIDSPDHRATMLGQAENSIGDQAYIGEAHAYDASNDCMVYVAEFAN